MWSIRTQGLKMRSNKIINGTVMLTVVGLSSLWITQHFGYVINLTSSLPQKLFLVSIGKAPTKGDYVVYKAPASTGLQSNMTLTKKVLGVAGDVVTRQDQNFYINGKWVAKAKKYSLKGEALVPGPEGVLPEGHYYVSTEHQDSFDSRYEKMGWVSQNQCLGVAYPIW